MKKLWLVVALVLMVVSANIFAGEDPVRGEIWTVYQAHLTGMKAKNLATVIETLHQDSPAFGNAKASVAQTMINFDLDYKVTSFSVVGVTGDFGIVRVKLETRKMSGSAQFDDNELDSLQIFRKTADGKWKIWSSSVLDVKAIGTPAAQPQQ